jgi:hypothetical protein
MEGVLGPALVAAAVIGLVAVLLILRATRRQGEGDSPERPFAASTEGMKVCPRCRQGNLWTERTCSACGAKLPS